MTGAIGTMTTSVLGLSAYAAEINFWLDVLIRILAVLSGAGTVWIVFHRIFRNRHERRRHARDEPFDEGDDGLS